MCLANLSGQMAARKAPQSNQKEIKEIRVRCQPTEWVRWVSWVRFIVSSACHVRVYPSRA